MPHCPLMHSKLPQHSKLLVQLVPFALQHCPPVQLRPEQQSVPAEQLLPAAAHGFWHVPFAQTEPAQQSCSVPHAAPSGTQH